MKRICDADIIKACVIGHAVGDALGVPVEFSYREKLDLDPVTGMRGYGTYDMPAGAWSDDTSMSLCALDSLAKDEFMWEDVMNNFASWKYFDAFTPTGRTFDIGRTCSEVITRYYVYGLDWDTCGLRDENSNGNGSLMRIIPFALYDGENVPFIEQASALTHAHRRSVMACVIYSFILRGLIEKKSKDAVAEGIAAAERIYKNEREWQKYAGLFDIADRSRDSIKSSGYVVSTLEAALWSFMTTESYSECVLKAVNLGRDTDTVGAVAGGLAGAYYGLDAIPQEWRSTLINGRIIEELCERAAERWAKDR